MRPGVAEAGDPVVSKYLNTWKIEWVTVAALSDLARALSSSREWYYAAMRLKVVSRLRLRQARDLWVFNRNELKTKGLPDGKSRHKNDVRLGV